MKEEPWHEVGKLTQCKPVIPVLACDPAIHRLQECWCDVLACLVTLCAVSHIGLNVHQIRTKDHSVVRAWTTSLILLWEIPIMN